MSASPLPGSPPAEVRFGARLTTEQEQARDTCIAAVREYQRQSLPAALALAQIKDEGLYVQDGTFADFAKKHFGFGSSRAYQLAAAGRLYKALDRAGTTPLPANEG